MPASVWFPLGLLFGITLVLAVHRLKRKEAKDVARELLAATEAQRLQDVEMAAASMKEAFGALSLEALSRNTGEFLQLAGEALSKHTQAGSQQLENKKDLIDQAIEGMKGELQRLEAVLGQLEGDRSQKFGELSAELKNVVGVTDRLQKTTGQLANALANTRSRGQWGERMAEDVLRLAGFVEEVNYLKQREIRGSGTRPDFTFLLPQGQKLNMDVKFPLDNYMKYLSAETDGEKESHKDQFLKDVRLRVKEVTGRDYINAEDRTLDYALVFIPNDQVYAFINENDRDLLDYALRNKVVLCSPLTLYAVLAVIRQTVDNFRLERTASEILVQLGAFQKQWGQFAQSLDKMGKKIDEARDEFQALTTTRRNQLERPLRRIEELRQEHGDDDCAVDLERIAVPLTVAGARL